MRERLRRAAETAAAAASVVECLVLGPPLVLCLGLAMARLERAAARRGRVGAP